MILNKNTILSAVDLARETVNVPEWGGDIVLQEMTALDREKLRGELDIDGDKVSTDNLAGRVLVRCIVDDAGVRIFNDDDAEILGNKGQKPLRRLFEKAMAMNAMFTDDEEEVKK